MKHNLLIITMVSVIVAVLAAYMQFRPSVRTYLLPDFHQHTTHVQTISLMQGDKHIDLVREGEVWWLINGMERREANVVKIYELLNSVEGLRILEKKTNNPQQFEALGVDPVQGLHIIIKDDTSQVIADIIAGKFRRMAGSSVSDQALYIRHADQDQVWLVAEKLEAQMDPAFWEKTAIEEKP